jgi:hypothetical protein
MSLENMRALGTTEIESNFKAVTDSHALNLTAFCPVENFAAKDKTNLKETGDAALNADDRSIEIATAQWQRIMEKFESLPEEYKAQVLTSFAPHMTGSNYPAYDKLRATSVG